MKSQIPDIKDLHQKLDTIVRVTSIGSGSTVLSNGNSATFTVTTTPNAATADPTTAVFLADVQATLYLTSVSVANAFPDGANIDMSQWQIMGPYSDWGTQNANNSDHKVKLYVRNISAGASKTVIIDAQSRIIVNSPSNTATQS